MGRVRACVCQAVFLRVMVWSSVIWSANAQGAVADDTTLADELCQILRHGLVQKGDLDVIGREVAAAKGRYPAEPRVPYAHGLILRHRLRPKSAADQFQTAIRLDKSYGPAWRSLIKIRLADKSADRLCDDLVALAEGLADTRDDWGATERHHLAQWLGRVHGFLVLNEVEIVPAAALNHNRTIVRRRLPAVLHADYEAGLHGLAADYDKRLMEIELAIADTESREAQRAAAELKRIENREKRIDRKLETSDLTRKQWATWLKEQLGLTEKRVDELKDDFDKLAEADRRLAEMQMQAQFDRQQLLLREESRQSASRFASTDTRVRHWVERELQEYAGERFSLRQQAARVGAAAQSVYQARAAAIRRYQLATGELRKGDVILHRWSEANTRSADELKKRLKSQRHRLRLVKQISRPANYFENDGRIEADRLLRELGTTLNDKSH